MIHDSSLTSPPVMDAADARAILDTLEELGVGLSQRQIDLKKKAKGTLAWWAEQEGRAQIARPPCPICHRPDCDSSLANCIERSR